MVKKIRVSDRVYEKLTRRKGDLSYSDLIKKLIEEEKLKLERSPLLQRS